MKRLCFFVSFLNFSIWAQPTVGPPSRNLLASLPLSFEPEQTQPGGASKYVSFGGNYKLELTPNEVVIGSAGGQVRMRLEGGNPKARVEPLERFAGISNYFMDS